MSLAQNDLKPTLRVGTLGAVILLLVVIAGLVFLVFPLKSQFDSNTSSLSQKEVQLNTLKSQLVEAQALKAGFTEGEVTQMDVLNLIPDEVKQDAVITILARSADETATSLNSLGFSMGSSRDTDSQSLNITLNVSGQRQALLRFLERLETASRKFRVNTITIQEMGSNLQNMNINVEAFFL